MQQKNESNIEISKFEYNTDRNPKGTVMIPIIIKTAVDTILARFLVQ